MFWPIASCAPTQPAISSPLSAGNDLTITLPKPDNTTILGEMCLSSTNHSAGLGIDHMTWTISDTLSLAVTICNWAPDPATILAVLAAAQTAVGKKPAAGLLDKMFRVNSNNKYNTLLFEISPGYVYRRLTWEHVGEVLGENGLPKFFETSRYWHTVYFDVIHSTIGELGQGAVRRWWQLDPPNSGSGIAVSDADFIEESLLENRSGGPA